MSDLADLVQRAAHANIGNDSAVVLNDFRSALRGLRAAYARGQAPDFSDGSSRAAYVFAYHPHHCVLGAETFAAAGSDLLGIKGPFLRVVCLGAGPGAELVALTWFLRDVPRMTIEAHLVDREAGWEQTRKTTLESTIPQWWHGSLDIVHHRADLSSQQGLTTVLPLVRNADLVTAQAVISELADPLSDGSLIDQAVTNFGADTRLLVIDLDTMKRRFDEVDRRMIRTDQAVTLAAARFRIPASRPLPEFDENLFDDADGLRARKSLVCAFRLLARPGVSVPEAGQDVNLSAGQSKALEAFDTFLKSSSRVFLLRGAAGTGKTTLFPDLVNAAARFGLPVVLLAPTGQAARRIGRQLGRPSSTLHSEVYRFEEALSDVNEDRVVSRFVPRDPPDEPAVYLVDESSLIGDEPDSPEEEAAADVLFGEGRLLRDFLEFALHAPKSRVVFVGDPNQLPPVGEQRTPALDVKSLEDLIGHKPLFADLAEVRRQVDGSGITELAQAWLTSHEDPPECESDPDAGVVLLEEPALAPWLSEEILSGSAVLVAARNADVRLWNERIRSEAGRSADAPVPGDRLVATRTDPITGVVNGDELEIVAVDEPLPTIRLRQTEVRLRPVELRVDSRTGGVVFRTLMVDDLLLGAPAKQQSLITQALLVDFIQRTKLRPDASGFREAYMADDRVHALRASYSYARTCHRAQGGEWSNIVVDFAGASAFGPARGRWAYTALTRAQHAVYLVNARRRTMDLQEAVAEAGIVLAEAGLEIRATRPIQNGAQLSIGDSSQFGDSVDVNLYIKKGLPSQAVSSGSDSQGIQPRAIKALDGWASRRREAALDPLPRRIEELKAHLVTDLVAQGYDVEASHRAAYEIGFTISTWEVSASLVYYFNSDGALTKEKQALAEGDLGLLEVLRASLRRHA